MNITGATDLTEMELTTASFDTMNSESMKSFLQKIRDKYQNARQIHLVLDNAGYNTSAATKEEAKKLRIKLHYLPPRSPNLNPIERV
ncbi:MAG: transposase [Holosporales bacterium]|jgi:transposase|nr:transposase [Holosporales bacterium]